LTNPGEHAAPRPHRFLLALCSIALLATSCGGSGEAVAADEEVVEATVVPLAADADGTAVYQGRCASCHGDDLRGTNKGPSQLSIVYEPNHHGDASFRSAIRNGTQQHHWDFGDMPAVTDITDEQIELVISYIREQQEALGFE